jgi:hypothetical protein
MNLKDLQSAYQTAIAAESTAKTAHDQATASRNEVLLTLSREAGPADDKRIVQADAAIKTTSTALEMAALARADAERAVHLAEIDWLTGEAERLKAAHASASEGAKQSAERARQALADAQAALQEWMVAGADAAQASRAGALFDTTVDTGYSLTNALLAEMPRSERPKTRLVHGTGTNRNLEIILQTRSGVQQGPSVIR